MGDVCPGITRDQLRRLCRGVRTSPRPRHTAAAARKLTRRGGADGGVRISGDGCGGGGDSGAGVRDGDRKWPRMAAGRMWRGCWWRISPISGAPLPVLTAGGTFTRLSITSQMSDAAATRAGDKEHCLQWRHGAMTTANPTHRRYPITSTTPDREGAQPSAEVTSPRVNLTSGSGVAVTSDRGYHQCGHPRPRPG